MSELYVWDTELTVSTGRCYIHRKTEAKPRLTDGKRHPVKIIRPAKKDVNVQKKVLLQWTTGGK